MNSASAFCAAWIVATSRLSANCCNRSWLVVTAAAAIVVAMAALFTMLPEELAPAEDTGSVMGIGSAPEGATIDYTDRYALQIVDIFAELPEQERFFSFSGFNGVTNTIDVCNPE